MQNNNCQRPIRTYGSRGRDVAARTAGRHGAGARALVVDLISDRSGIIMIAALILLVSAVSASNEPGEIVVNHVERADDAVADTDLLMAFVIFRHGDRTPDDEELDLNQGQEQKTKNYFPYGLKALTNVPWALDSAFHPTCSFNFATNYGFNLDEAEAGKMRGYRVGEFLRQRYDGFLSRLYLPGEISVRCTGYDRTKMTALTALAALYAPPPAQKWNPTLDWQPVPYDVLPNTEDNLLYWYFCPRYLWLRNRMYERPEVQQKLKPYDNLYKKLSEYTKTNISTPEDVFYLDNLFQAEANVGIRLPKWAIEMMPQIKEMTKIEFELEFYTDELIRLASGVLISSILDEIEEVIKRGDKEPSPKMRLYSAHENNVAALMAAVRVFRPHQPKYGATFSMELRRQISTGAHGIVAVYVSQPGAKETLLPINGCGGEVFCDYATFLNLTQNVRLSRSEYDNQCPDLESCDGTTCRN
ncbi:Venom acid phosphatase Acph-1 [Eumeta japonica]|uniref:acid phosphatase n=1 Tax=Eumeta variegata TaxID=151549 RepID=A0A4C1X7I3_EUMVA|nr:Venom acid phosphatase Acph-1 [Eumeta japonica]